MRLNPGWLRTAMAMCAFAAWNFFSPPAIALQPDQVFSKAAPSITMVFASDGKKMIQGSGVVVGQEKVVTNCHVVQDKRRALRTRLIVKHQGRTFSAEYLTGDDPYDTCLLRVSGLKANPVTIADVASLRIGQRVYAVGAPAGLDLTLTDGLISSLRTSGGTQIIQTSAPISPGSSGGGLFNENGDLIGITSFGIGSGTGLNFAYLADRILTLVALAKAIGDSSDDSPLAASVNAALHAAVSDRAAPEPKFSSVIEKVNWLTEMSRRLEKHMPDRQARNEFLKTVHYEAQRAGLDPQLVLAFISKVSGFRKHETSPLGARGYMQVMPFWVKQIGHGNHDLFHLRTNLRFGCTILRHYLDVEKGDLYRALIRYHYDLQGKRFLAEITEKDARFPNAVRTLWESQWNWRTG